jgi:AcrR family transcriptional regulator
MSPSSKTVSMPVTKRGHATRQSILDSAEEVFGELGYDKASVSEITRRAGVAQGTFYLYFGDKKAVFIELVHHLNSILRRRIATELTDVTDRIQMERIGIRTFFDFVHDHTALYKVMREAQFVDPDTYAWHYDTIAAGYRRGIEAAIDAGQLSPDLDPETAVDVLLGAAEFIGWKYAIRGGGAPSVEQLDHLVAFFARGLQYRGGSE